MANFHSLPFKEISMRFIKSLALISLVGIASVASAASTELAPTKAVAYGDLNVNSVAGAKALYSRLRAAAREVCEPVRSIDSMYPVAFERCYTESMSRAVARIDSETLSRVHAEALHR
jgi:UrcA family protein